ncbi:hypothetical protein DV701_11275 [Ornithinimicrobium avium]|uniref:Uncharacterized protein n=1 Tax=Ornithinimicrobium avium TaxID=2283195 RepID=A0A345NNL8_9MICO|nr:hypothetical protein DV701_11275 [Ornithinimicrobium avium]
MLLSGQQPYLDEPASWASMRRLVGPITITFRGLAGAASEASVRLTPNLWPERPAERIGDWVGELTLDGEATPVAELFDLLDVVHLSGTERLADTLSQQTGRLHRSLSVVNARLGCLYDARADLGELAERLVQASPAQDAADRARRKAAQEQLTDIADRLDRARPFADDLTEASMFAAMVEGGSVAEHQEKLKGLQQQLEEAHERVRLAEEAQVKALAELSQGNQVQKAIATRERRVQTLERNLTKQLARLSELAPRLEAAGLPSDAESLGPRQLQTLDRAIEAAASRQYRIHLAAASSHRTREENQLVDDVRVVLDDAVGSGLSETVLARVHDVDITVQGLRSGLGYLPVADSDLEELTAANRELAELREVADLYAKREKANRDRDELLEEMQQLDPDAADHDELRKRASNARTELDDATAAVRALNMRIGAMSRGVLGDDGEVIDFAARLTEILEQHSVEADQLQPALSAALMEVATLTQEASETEARIEELARSEQRRRRMRSSLRREAASDPDTAWLGELANKVNGAQRATTRSAEDMAEDSLTDDDWPDATWQGLANHVCQFKDTMDRLVAAVGGLEAIAARPISALAATPMDSAVKAVVEEEALRELSARPIVDALFDGGALTRVSLEEGESTITWHTPEGESRTRPMSAFSSGQQALGFMRARLQQVADEAHENRLVFLDEFGAFISAEQRRPLADLLTSSELQALTDQVVVVLPLQADYGGELDQTTGELHTQYERRARDVDAHGYFTEKFQG